MTILRPYGYVYFFFYAVAETACVLDEDLEVLRLCILRRELGFHDRAGVGKPNLTFWLVLPTTSLLFLFAQGLRWPDTLYVWKRQSKECPARPWVHWPLAIVDALQCRWILGSHSTWNKSSEGQMPGLGVVSNRWLPFENVLLARRVQNALADFYVSPTKYDKYTNNRI